MKNKWFYDVFLTSIFESTGADKKRWLSQKQTLICIENMDKNTICYDADGYGTKYKHDNYTCEWYGRKVFLSYSKKNGCGCIEFGYNADELAVLKAEREAEKARIEAERIERIKRKPERLERKIAGLNKKIEKWQEEYEMDIADGETELAKQDLKFIEELQKELAVYMS